MKIEKPFHVKLQPHYVVNEPIDNNTDELRVETENVGGLYISDGDADEVGYRSGGKIDWFLFRELDTNEPEVNINIMRLWTLQMVTQMVNDKAFVNEIDSEPKFNFSDEEKTKFLEMVQSMTETLHDELENVSNRIVLKKKNSFNFE